MIIVNPPDLHLRAPRLVAPPGSTDCHFHIFGPESRYPYVPVRRFTPPTVTEAEFEQVCATLGITRAVLVQPSGYGFDNSRALDAARTLKLDTRLVVVLPLDAPDSEWARHHDAGARGLRMIATQPGGLGLADLERAADRMAELGWHIQLLVNPDQLLEAEQRLATLPCPVVIDHMAHCPAEGGTGQAPFQAILRLLASGNVWVKLSGGYHLSKEEPPYRDILPMVHALVAARPDRLVWASDWPHVTMSNKKLSSTDLFDLLLDWVPDGATRVRVLVDNPAGLYGFGRG